MQFDHGFSQWCSERGYFQAQPEFLEAYRASLATKRPISSSPKAPKKKAALEKAAKHQEKAAKAQENAAKALEKAAKAVLEITVKKAPTKRNVRESLKKQIACGQNWHCKICKNTLPGNYEVDHIVSLKSGGSNDANNLQALCRNCHGEKTQKENAK